MAAGGYPLSPETGKEIEGLTTYQDDYAVFHAGTKSKVVTSGGRVLGVISTGKDLQQAIDKAYKGIDKVSFENMHHRTDIGRKGLKLLKKTNGSVKNGVRKHTLKHSVGFSGKEIGKI